MTKKNNIIVKGLKRKNVGKKRRNDGKCAKKL